MNKVKSNVTDDEIRSACREAGCEECADMLIESGYGLAWAKDWLKEHGDKKKPRAIDADSVEPAAVGGWERRVRGPKGIWRDALPRVLPSSGGLSDPAGRHGGQPSDGLENRAAIAGPGRRGGQPSRWAEE